MNADVERKIQELIKAENSFLPGIGILCGISFLLLFGAITLTAMVSVGFIALIFVAVAFGVFSFFVLSKLFDKRIVSKRFEVEQEIIKVKLKDVDNLEILKEYPYFVETLNYIKQNGFVTDFNFFKNCRDSSNNYQVREVLKKHCDDDLSEYIFNKYVNNALSYDNIKRCLSEPPYGIENQNLAKVLCDIDDVRLLLGFEPSFQQDKINSLLYKSLSLPEISHKEIITYDEMVKRKRNKFESELADANQYRRSSYFNHCWKCHGKIDGSKLQVCPKCKKYYICPNCGYCKCGYNIEKGKKAIYMPFD